MIEINELDYNFDYERDHCECGNASIVTLNAGNCIRIPLCKDCLKELYCQAEEAVNKIRCIDCQRYIRNKYGTGYHGGCVLDTKPIDREYYDSCPNAIKLDGEYANGYVD